MLPNVWEPESYSENSDDSKTVKNEPAQNNLKRLTGGLESDNDIGFLLRPRISGQNRI